jgi:6-pyruvoyl-tetrahydropterin synthase
MNPTVAVSITRTFIAEHSLPLVGVAQRHEHSFTIECGYAAEIDPDLGCARPMQEVARDVDAVVAQLEGSYLNDVLPGPPTAEMLACWILAQLSSCWDWVSVRAYDGFKCKVARRNIP